MYTKIILMVVQFFGICHATVLGNTPGLFIRDNREYSFSLKDGLLLADSSNQFSIDTLSKMPDSFFNFDVKMFNPKFHNTLWIKLDFYVAETVEKKWILEIFNKQAEEIIIFVEQNPQSYVALDTIGISIPFYNRNVFERLPAFEIPLHVGHNTVFVKYKSYHDLGLNANIQPYRNYINFSNHYYFLIGGFYFVLLILILYNLLFFISTRDKIYLYYIVFVFTSALDCLMVDHIGFALLWPNHPEVNGYAEKYVRILFVFGFINYAIYFLSVKNDFKNTYRFVWSMFAFFVLLSLVQDEFFPGFSIGLYIKELFLMTMFLVLGKIAIHRLQQNHKPTKIFIVGYFSILLGFAVTYMFYSDWIGGNLLVYYILFYAITIDAFMFSFALSSRLRHERLEKERALETENSARLKQIELMEQNEKLLNKVNNELEEKVIARTAEIEESKRRIAEQSEIIFQLNINLDKENWRLNKTIKSLNLKKVLPENLTYKQMLVLFPSESDYYGFLADHKWNSGFQCKKCQNNKEARIHDFYSRRCSKCGFIESITANTIFHKLKFPLDKAFYIAYAVSTFKENLIVADLSQELELNYKTCLNFKFKIEAAIEKRKKRGLTIKSWEDLISDT